MDFAEAIEFSKKFPTCRPKICKGFEEWDIRDTETEGYVVLADSALVKKLCLNELEDYVKRNELRIRSRTGLFDDLHPSLREADIASYRFFGNISF
ncbi:MAG: hypothetical protein ABSF65_07700 [Candidatus Bathyarchaeia archaeon]|jgi:hypothetical protein